MVRSVRIELILDTLRGVRGAKDLSKAVGETADSLGDTAREGDKAARAIDDAGDEMSQAARAAASLDREVEKLTGSLREMAVSQALTGENFSKQIRAQETEVRRLSRNRKLLGDFGSESGEDAALGFAARFSSRVGPLIASGPGLGIAGAGIGLALAPTAASAIAAGIIGGAGIGGVVGGAILASKDERVQAAGKDLSETVLASLERRAGQFVGPMLDGIGEVKVAWASLGGDLDRIFASSRFVDPLVGGAIEGGQRIVTGLADLVSKADPVMAQLGDTFARVGAAAGTTLSLLSNDADEGASSLDDLTMAVQNFVTISGYIVHAGAAVKGWSDQLDQAIDKGRVWIEDNSWLARTLSDVGISLDITADGFKKGSVEAEAYRRVTTGAGTAVDEARLKAYALADAQGLGAAAARAAGDAAAAEATAHKATADAMEIEKKKTVDLAAQQAQLKVYTDAVKTAQEGLAKSLASLGGATSQQGQRATALKTAMDNLYGAAIRNTDANEAYQASVDSLSDSVSSNGRSLSINTAAGRANRDALEGLLTSSGELYLSNIAAGVSTDRATRKHRDRIAAVKEEARRLGLNKTETQKLIDTYGKIPGKKTTELVLDGLQSVAKALTDLYIFQRSLATGRSIESVETTIRKGSDSGPAKRFGGYVTGGWTGPGAMYDEAGTVHADEFVIRKQSRRRIESRNPGLLDEMNATGQLPGYAGGGLVARVDTSRRWPFSTDVGGTRIPSRAEVASKVPFAFGNWPPSPAAQRGDSGVWRRIVALINSTGPFSGSFGNAYRAGDPKWHGSGRAVDWMGFNQDRLASFLAARRPLELIHRTNTRDYAYTRGVNKGSFNESLMNAHRNHVHIAMANGGMIREPVFGYGLRTGASYSLGERGNEHVLTERQYARSGGGGGTTYVLQATFTGPVGSQQQLDNWLTSSFARLKSRNRV